MSAEENVTDALQQPVEQNAEAAEEAKRMLAELEGEAAAGTETKETNGTSEEAKPEADAAPTEDKAEDAAEKSDEHKQDSPERSRGDNNRGRGGGRGRGRGGHSHGNNIKSVLTKEEESSDPVEIRKQVHSLQVQCNKARANSSTG